MSSPEHKQKIWNMIKGIKTGMLNTRHGKELRSRPMTLVQQEYDGTLWFFTDLDSEKVFEVEGDNDVCVSFADTQNDTYVCLTGVGRAMKDKNLIDKYWNGFVSVWFPEGKESPNVGMLEIKVQKGEHWDADTSTMVKSYKMAKAKLKGELPDIGEHEKFGS
ncbi:pyridoxamine 5'-phosphate oxidase family protein [Halopseudomonas sp.]|uniref:pyridoxamine 5'-phosphate oxidase family protein n=1 Tax=Halopseudomonas sp. TaxID=2901191 RepID=UPI003562A40C